jgi:LPXTG-motif cell wall-anchored protein
MKKVIAGLLVAIAAAFMTMGSMSAAQAYPDTNPTNSEVKSGNVTTTSPTTASSALPSTGGPNETLLVGGAALLLAGGAAVVVARRRQTD